jgi:hypothetical protein
MANELRFVDGNLLFDGGSLAMNVDCCCDNCCNDPGGPPTADISYEQTADTPDCKINLFDESVAGTCGEIVSWAWTLNGSPLSTSQNPTNITVETGDEIGLTVTDSYGCTDSVVGEVTCEAPSDTCCQCYPASLPATVSITVDNFLDFVGIDDCSEAFNQTFSDIPLIDPGSSLCQWQKEFTVPYAGDITITVDMTGLGNIEVQISVNSTPATANWSHDCPSGPNCSTATIDMGTANPPIAGITGMGGLCGMGPGHTPQPTCILFW